MNLRRIGLIGEKFAEAYLQKKGFKILARNYRTRMGEIDLIGKIDDTLVFFEVKTRLSDRLGKPYESITPFKLKNFQKAINFYLLENNDFDQKMRVDAISIILHPDLSVKVIQHFENITEI